MPLRRLIVDKAQICFTIGVSLTITIRKRPFYGMPDQNFDEIFASEQADNAKFELIELLIACPNLSSPILQRNIVNTLPQRIKVAIQYGQNDTAKIQMLSIYQSCREISGGLKALYSAVRFADAESIGFHNLQAFLQKLISQSPAKIATPNSVLAIPRSELDELEVKFEQAFAAKRWAETIRIGEEISRKRKDANIRAKLAEAYYEHGLAFAKLGHDKEAIQELLQAVNLAPGNSDYLLKLAEINEARKAIREAFTYYNKAAEIDNSKRDCFIDFRKRNRRALIEQSDQIISSSVGEEILRDTIATMQPIGNGSYISIYITNAEYQIFLNDVFAQYREYYQPIHWSQEKFNSGRSLEPVTGITPRQANRFCEWLFEKFRHKFHLVYSYQVQSVPDKRVDVGAWYVDQDGYSHIQLDKNTEEIIQQRLRRLTNKPFGFDAPSKPTFDLEKFLDLDADCARALHLTLPLNIQSILRIIFAVKFDFASELDNMLMLAIDISKREEFSQIQSTLQAMEYEKALNLIEQILKAATDNVIASHARLLKTLIKILLADRVKNFFRIRLASCECLMQYAEYAYIGLNMNELEQESTPNLAKQAAIDMYFWARIQIERNTTQHSTNKFPVWEGLRVVREGN
jgi:tetratricopeptide (TPR) repeat protein